MIDVVIPMAGNGQRFRDAGFVDPKPLIDIAGRPMIVRVMESLSPAGGAWFVLVSRLEAVPSAGNVTLVGLDEPTRGAAETLLKAADAVTSDAVIVANCDQLLFGGVDDFLAACAGYDAGIVTFNSTNPHHSYVCVDGDDVVTKIAEKQVISDNALLGIYWFADADCMFDYAAEVLNAGIRVNGEFYISSILQFMVDDGMRIKAFEVDVHDKHILGTPEELTIFLDKVAAGRVVL